MQPKIAKNSLKPLFLGQRSFKVIDVGTPGKLVISACLDAGAVEFRRLTASNFHGVEVVD